VEKPQKNIITKKHSVDVQNKHVNVSMKKNANKVLHKENKENPIDKVDNITIALSNSSDISDNQEYEDDFEVK